MRLTFRHGDRLISLEGVAEAGRQHIVIDGREHVVEARYLDDATLALQVDGRRVIAHLAREGRRRLVAVGGRVFDLTSQQGASPQDGGTTTADPRLTAPMPGKVLQVFVSAGARIEAGDALLILEAMKMENQLTAPAAGIVEEVLVAVADMVQGGQVLIVLRFD